MTDNNAPGTDIEPRMVLRYLQNHGWIIDAPRNNIRRAWLPEDDEGDQVEIFLSNSEKRHRDVHFAINTISQLYSLPTFAIENDIRSLAYDIITSKIPSEYVRNATIELRIAAEYIEKMKAFLASSATTELSGERFYKRLAKEAIEYSERCRFGHTFKGSFGFQIESPVGLNDEPALLPVEQEVPFERRVVERVANGFVSLRTAIAEEDPAPIVKETRGFGSNMCDLAADMIEDLGISKIDFGIAMSSEWLTATDVKRQTFTLEYRHLEILRSASKTLRVEDAPRDTQVFGRIKKLQTDGNPADLLEDAKRQIEVGWLNEDSQIVNVKLFLSPSDYLAAVEAHKGGKVVSASGTLQKKGRSWHLTDVSKFSVI
ncbi:hypothetical protein [Agrobacterium tumefaciens]|uniref:hypothetical protein n=1 Tax=Agrobacterium tumefaciens TaxID=358 RepID=UPI003BA3AF02